MPAWAIITIVIVCVLVAVAAAIGATRELRMIATRRQFGREFDRLARRVGARRARAELIERRQRVAALSLHPLPPERQQDFAASWTAAQEQFVEVPSAAVATAARLVTEVARERGYPVEDRARLLADLSVNHAERMDGYRRAERMAADPEAASTEDLRQAMLGYRAMFRDLADSGARSPSAPASTPGSADGGQRAASPGPATVSLGRIQSRAKDRHDQSRIRPRHPAAGRARPDRAQPDRAQRGRARPDRAQPDRAQRGSAR